MKSILSVLFFLMFTQFGFSQWEGKQLAYDQIQDINVGVLLIRIHSDDAVIAKMKELNQKNLLKAKRNEVLERNTSIYTAFQNGFTFTDTRFFYGRDSDQILKRNYSGIFLDSNLNVDPSITLPDSIPIFIIDVGDIYFEAFGGHFEGMVVMNDSLKPLVKPFPFYVRKRSGLAIIKRTDLDMVGVLQADFEEFYNKARDAELAP